MPRISSLPSRSAAQASDPLQEQFKAQERKLRAQEQKQLEAAPSPAERAALKKSFAQTRRARGQRFAAMVCSQPGRPQPGRATSGTVLTAFYALLGERARQQAARTGKPFSLAHFDEVRLTKGDIEALRRQFGDEQVKAAWPSLQKHIAHDGFLDADALRFIKSNAFLSFQAMLMSAVDKVERAIDAHQDQLSEKDAEALREHNRLSENRRLTHWDGPVRVENEQKPDGTHDRVVYVSVGGRLVPVDRDPES